MDLSRPLAVVTPTVDADVLAVLAGAETSFTGRQVHHIAGRHSEKGTRNALQRLCRQGVVLRERVGGSDLYTLNREHLAAGPIEALARLRTELLDRMSTRVKSWGIPPAFAALFGSAARGDMLPDSDIDVFVVRPESVDTEDARWGDQLAGLSRDVTAWTGNDTRVLDLSEKETRRGISAGDEVLAEIRAHGLILYGPLSYLNASGGRRALPRRG